MPLEDNLKEQYAESKRIINDAQRDGNLVLFVGAGASIASGMPTWGNAIQRIATHLGINDFSSEDYLRIPQYYYISREQKEYTQLMQDVFLYRKFLPTTSIHDLIVDFNTQTIITTNYDHLIEQAVEKHSEMIHVVSKDTDLPYRRSGRELIKMHGDFENDNFVLKENDYLEYSKNFKLIENYIKSIIGTKVVLFIGYSFNDPDVKHVFSWTKEILQGDFQPAYLINVDDDYNLNADRYFKNFGINVLYSSIMLADDNSKFDKTERLGKMLEWLLERRDSRSELEELYDELRIFNDFNYSYGRRIEAAFRKRGYRYDHGYLALELFPNHHTFIKDYEVLNHILFAIVYARYKQKPENVYVETEKDEKKRFIIDESFKAKNDEKGYVDSLLEVLNKSAIKGVMVFATIDEKYPKLPDEKVFMGTHHRIIADFNDAKDIPEWQDCIIRFDDDKLRKRSEKNNSKLNDSTPDLYMEQASIHSYFEEYLASYNCLKTASSLYYKRGEIVKYFIAETDRYYIGKLITRSGIAFGLSAEEVQDIAREISSINLDRTYWSLPDLGSGMSILKDICSFDIAFKLFQDAYKKAEEVKDQANTKYNLFAGLPAFSAMQRDINDYLNFEFRNHIILDRYGENNLIYKLYFKSMLASVISPDLGDAEKTSNIHADKFTPLELFIALKYISYQDLKKMLLEDEKIPVDEDSLKYLYDVIKCSREPHKEWIFSNNFPFWKTILLMGYFDVSKPLFSAAINNVCECMKGANYREYGNSVIRLIDNAETLDIISDDDITHIKRLLNNLLLYLSNDGKCELLQLLGLAQFFAHICNKHGSAFDDVDVLNSLYANQTITICMELYPSLGENSQNYIKDKYMSWIPNDKPDDYILYCKAVGVDIIEMNEGIEKKIIEYITGEKQKFDKLKADKEKSDVISISIGAQEPDFEKLIGLLCDLYLRKHIVNAELLKEIVRNVGDPFYVWLIDLDSFDYSNFKVEWLNRCYPPLLEDIRKNDRARTEIGDKISEFYLQGKVDKRLLKRYFKYIGFSKPCCVTVDSNEDV